MNWAGWARVSLTDCKSAAYAVRVQIPSLPTIGLVLLVSSPAATQELSPDYQQGFCDGAKASHEASMLNRDHNRRLTASIMGRPFESYEEAIKRIYSEHGKDWCIHGPTLVHDSECLMLDRIDLYVVLPPWQGGQIMTPKGVVDCGGESK